MTSTLANYQEADALQTVIANANHIVVLQADNPDADSLASALALEEIFAHMGKRVSLYCAIDMPVYLRYLSGWDRVRSELPPSFDVAILVDAATSTLLRKLATPGFRSAVAQRPFVVLDHHAVVQNSIPYATITIIDETRAATGELLFLLAKQLAWELPLPALAYIMTSILGDTQGLTNSLATASTYRIMAELVEAGVDRTRLEEQRRAASGMPAVIFRYKAELIKRTELLLDNQLGVVHVPQHEINTFSPLYNPAPLIQTDMLQIVGLRLSIVFKTYSDGHITAAIRANASAPIAHTLAEHMGGGGHAFASGFKVDNGSSFADVKARCIAKAIDLLQTEAI